MKTYSEEYQKLLHAMHYDHNHFGGGTLQHYLTDIKETITKHDITSILDYGCGKGHMIPEEWNNIRLYDPGYQPYAKKPKSTYDLVISTDMLEHIEPEYLDNVLEEIYGYANKAVYLAISTVKAKKTLPDGRNAHLIVETEEWWIDKIKQYQNNLTTRVAFKNSGETAWDLPRVTTADMSDKR